MTSSNPSPLLRIPRFDKRGHFLLHITPTSPDAPFPQNLACSVKATEGERAFAVTRMNPPSLRPVPPFSPLLRC